MNVPENYVERGDILYCDEFKTYAMVCQVENFKYRLITVQQPDITDRGNRFSDQSLPFYHDNGKAFINLPDGWEKTNITYPLINKIDLKILEDEFVEFPEEKPPVVKLTRFFRPIDYEGEIYNDLGATFAIKIDYTKKLIEYNFSVCWGDNFNKKDGTRLAWERFYDLSQDNYFLVFDTIEGGVMNMCIESFLEIWARTIEPTRIQDNLGYMLTN